MKMILSRLTLSVMGIIGILTWPAGPVSQAAEGAPGPAIASGDVGAQAFSAPAGYIVHGAHISPVAQPSAPWYYQEIGNFEAAVGKELGIVMYYRPWDSVTDPCDNGYLPGYVDGNTPKPGVTNGPAIMLTWMPFDQNTYSGSNPGAADYDNVLAGTYDTLIENCAKELSGWSNKTFIIRLMHEMNIPASYWWAGHPYNLKGDGTGDVEKFVQTWRHIVDVFRAQQAVEGVNNVQWLWAPNYASSDPPDGWNELHNYYPGDGYVDWIGLSGYNWYPYLGYSAPQTYAELYDGILTDLQCRHAKSIVHAEIGSTHSGLQAKGAWITDAYTRLQAYPLVRAVTWFNDYAFHSTDSADFRVAPTSNFAYLGGTPFSSTPAGAGPGTVVSAYQTALSDNSFTSAFDSSQLLNPPMTRCAGDMVSANGVLGVRPSTVHVARQGLTSASFIVGALGLGSDTTFTLSGCPAGVTCAFVSSGSASSTTRSAPWSADSLVVTTTPGAALGLATLTLSGGGGTVQVQVNIVQTIFSVYLPFTRR